MSVGTPLVGPNPGTVLSTVPLPVPASVTVSWTAGCAGTEPESGKLNEGLAGSLVLNVRLPLKSVPPAVPTGGVNATSRRHSPPPGATGVGAAPGIWQSFESVKPAGTLTFVTSRSSSPLFVIVTSPGLLLAPANTGPNGVSKEESTTADGARTTFRVRLF